MQELGRLDTVINNAGVMLLGPIVDAPVEEWDRMVDLNLNGLLYVAHAALPHLLRAAEAEPRRVADLVNISSVAGRRVGAGRRRLPADQARRRRVQRGAAPGGHRAPRALVAGRAGRDRDRAGHARARGGPQPARTPGVDEILEAEDIADAIAYIVTRPRHVAVNEMLIRPTEQVR